MEKPHIEKEYKMMIDEKIYDMLTQNQKSFHQTNFYYTSNSNSGMRIREKGGKYIFTLKIRKDDYAEEYEFEIPENSLDNKRIKELLNNFNIKNPQYLGKMETQRTIIKLDDGEICIDKNSYLNEIDYEIEYELYDASIGNNQELLTYLKKYNLEYIPNTITKYARFLNKLKR